MLQPPSPILFFPTGERNKHCYATYKTTKEIPHSFTTVKYISREPTYLLRSWEAQAHLYHSLGYLLSKHKRSKPCLLFSLPLPIIRHYFRCIHNIRLRLLRVMFDTITLPCNLIIGFGVPSAGNRCSSIDSISYSSAPSISMGDDGGCTRPLSLYGSRSNT
jgi:hypothetical protein